MRFSDILRRGLLVLTAAVLTFALAVPALADAWIPPDDNVNYWLMDAPWSDDNCRTLNVFISNYIEAGLLSYNSIADDAASQAMTTALKHIELNGLAEDVYTENGQTVMKVNAKKFTSVCERLFDMDVKASKCPGYSDGAIYVTAENYKPTPHIVALVYTTNYLGNGVYTLYFDVYRGSGNVSEYYGAIPYDMDKTGLELLGDGSANIYYMGHNETFKVEDFELRYLKAYVTRDSIPYLAANTAVAAPQTPAEDPVEPVQPDEPPEKPAEDPRKEPNKPAEDPDTIPEEEPEPPATEPDPAPAPEPTPVEPAPESSAKGGKLSTPAVVAIALAAAAGAFAAVLVIFRKKK